MTQKNTATHSHKRRRGISRAELPLHLMLIPGIVIIFIFHYIPLGGLVIAFQRFIPAKGLFGNQKWVGLQNFEYIFSMPNTMNVLTNTVVIAGAKIVLNLIIPITVALMLNELQSSKLKRTVQTVIYFPHFLSWIIFGSIIMDLLSPQNVIVNKLLGALGTDPIFFLGDNRYFRQTIIWTDIWKNFGYGTVVYMASITSIDPTLYEAGRVDGASRWQMLWRITLPCLAPTICIMLILQCGRLMSLGYEKIYLMQNDLNIAASEVISTYVYKSGLINAEYSFSTAVGLFNSVINCILLFTVNFITGKLSDTRIF